MEDKLGSAALSHDATQRSSGWMVSPLFDLLFLANVGWVVLLLPGVVGRFDTPIDFWQLYFLTLPHRWITLLLVMTDPERREGNTVKLTGLAVLAALLVVGAQFVFDTLLCLAMIDLLWNAWHFASQHAGVLRAYSRKVGGGYEWLERWGLRLFVTYAILRGIGWTTGWLEGNDSAQRLLIACDWLMLGIPLALIAGNLRGFTSLRVGKLAYLSSVCLLYALYVVSLQNYWRSGILACAAAGSMFHAVEYLAFVSFYTQRRVHTGGDSLFRRLALHWLLFLAVYVVVLGTIGSWLSHPDHEWFGFWQGLNLWAAFVHYGFDGIIWKLRRPATALTLGLSNP